MPIISFTKGDALRSKVVEAMNYLGELVENDGPKPSSSGKGVNYWLTFRITAGPVEGKELKMCLSSGVNNGSVLGGTQFEPTSKFLEIEAAVNNHPIAISDMNVDTDSLMNKPMCLVVGAGADPESGKLVNTITAFLPAAAANNKPAF